MALGPQLQQIGPGQVQVPPPQTIGGLSPQPAVATQMTPGGLQGNISNPQTIGSLANRPRGFVNNTAGVAGGGNPAPVTATAGNPGDYQAQIDAAYEAQTRRLDPMFEQRQREFDQRMVNQGLSPGTPGYDAALANFQRDRNDAYNSAGYGSQAAGLQAYDTLTQHDLAREGMANQLAAARIGAGATRAASANAANASMYGADLRHDQYMAGLGQQRYEFDVNDIFRTNQQDINAGLDYGRLGLAQDQFGLQAWQAQNQANNDRFNQIGALFNLAPGYQGFNAVSNVAGNANQAAAINQHGNNAFWGSIGRLAGDFAQGYSSIAYKDLDVEVDTSQMLDSLNSMDIYEWKYNDNAPTPDRDKHIGSTAEQFNAMLGLSAKDHINFIDMGGALIAAIQELTKRVERLER